MITTIVFDIGGVFLHQPADQMQRIAQRFGLNGSKLEHMMYGDDLWEDYKRGRFTEDALWEKIPTRLPSNFSGDIDELRKAVDFAEVLDMRLVTLAGELKGRYRIAALSNAGAELERRLEELGLANLFEWVINSHRVGMAKPDVEIYRYTCEKLGVLPGEILFVDDKERNTRVADEIGLVTHVYTTVSNLVDHLDRLGIR